jgi:hypothetical protein
MAASMKLSKSCALRLNEKPAESRVLANDDREAAEQAAAIIIGKWSDPGDRDDTQLTSESS